MIRNATDMLLIKWKRALRILLNEGVLNLLWELMVYCVKPLRLTGENIAWWAYRASVRNSQLSAHVLGHRLYLMPEDTGISKELVIYKVHEPRATQLLERYVKEGMTVVDIGSNLGYYALLEARLVGRRGKVVAIEPVPDNARFLAMNVKANCYSNIVICEAAIGECNSEVPLHLSEKSNLHSLVPLSGDTGKHINVSMLTLDSLVSRYKLSSVDFIRMDIEGYETVAIEGMRRTLQAHNPYLLIELHPHLVGADRTLQYLRKLKAFGYRVEYVVDRSRDDVWRGWRLPLEKVSVDELVQDQRITIEERALTVLLSKPLNPTRGSPIDTAPSRGV